MNLKASGHSLEGGGIMETELQAKETFPKAEAERLPQLLLTNPYQPVLVHCSKCFTYSLFYALLGICSHLPILQMREPRHKELVSDPQP